MDQNLEQPEESALAGRWFEHKLNEAIGLLDEQFASYRLSDALMTVYKLFWDEFSSWYLEAIKPAFQKPVDPGTFQQANDSLEKLVALLHPFMPFITEEIWQYIRERKTGESLMISRMPEAGGVDEDLLTRFRTGETNHHLGAEYPE